MNTLTWAVSDQLADTKPLGQPQAPSNSFLGPPRPQGLRPQVQMAGWALGGLAKPTPLGSSQGIGLDPEEVGISPQGGTSAQSSGLGGKGRGQRGCSCPSGQRGHPVLRGWVVTPIPDTTAVLALT